MFFYAGLVSKTCKGTWFCCLDPHRRVSPTQRTTRYSVFKERPRPWELVENSLGQTCTGSQGEHGQESPARCAHDGGRNLRDGSLLVKSNSGAHGRLLAPARNSPTPPALAARPRPPTVTRHAPPDEVKSARSARCETALASQGRHRALISHALHLIKRHVPGSAGVLQRAASR